MRRNLRDLSTYGYGCRIRLTNNGIAPNGHWLLQFQWPRSNPSSLIQTFLSATGFHRYNEAAIVELSNRRYRKLARGGKPADVVTAAIARELAGFVWAIARHVPTVVD
jgi:hypothetical protein